MSAREVRVARVWPETPLLLGVFLEAEPDLRALHVKPGQVIAARLPEGPKVYLALCSVPGSPHLELLAAPSAREKLGFEPGQTLAIEGPFGRGFPVEAARGKDVLLFAVGSALGPVKALVEMIREDRSEYGRVSLYIGAVSAEAFAYQSQYEAWMRDRIDIVKVVDPEWVQDVFANDPLPLEDSVAYVCGMDAMMDGVTETLARFGLPHERVHRNW